MLFFTGHDWYCWSGTADGTGRCFAVPTCPASTLVSGTSLAWKVYRRPAIQCPSSLQGQYVILDTSAKHCDQRCPPAGGSEWGACPNLFDLGHQGVSLGSEVIHNVDVDQLVVGTVSSGNPVLIVPLSVAPAGAEYTLRLEYRNTGSQQETFEFTSVSGIESGPTINLTPYTTEWTCMHVDLVDTNGHTLQPTDTWQLLRTTSGASNTPHGVVFRRLEWLVGLASGQSSFLF